MTHDLTLPNAMERAIAVLSDRGTPMEDRAALYSSLHQIQLAINRALKANRDDIVVHMESTGLSTMGPLSIKATAIDVKWPVNDPANWTDEQVQGFLAVTLRVAPDYVRVVPDHLEIDSAALGAGVAAGDPVARTLHRELKRQGLRTEEGRRLSLSVRPAPQRKEQSDG